MNPKVSVMNMNCYYMTLSIVLKWHLVKFNITVAVNFVNGTCICTYCRALTVNLQKFFYNSQASVGDRQYTIILFISNIFLHTILNYLNERERWGAIIFCKIIAPPNAPSPDATILNYLNDKERGRHYLL